jgi:UDP-N-acetylmuramate dehydrogenase
MNAGGGKTEGLFISRYLKSVSYLCNGERIEANVSELEMGFRKSLFSERRDCIIISATFRFPKTEFISNPVTERLDWAREHQDLKIPNCGSVWRAFSFPLLRLAENLFRRSPAYFSKKSLIWISNKSTDHRHILRILRVVRLLHLVAFRKCEHEIRIVD